MEFYRACDLVLASNVPLPELPPANGSEPECSFQVLSGRGLKPASKDWFHQWYFPDGEPWLRMAKQESDFLLRFPDLADFVVSTDGKLIQCYPGSETPIETLRHLLLDQVIPLVLSHRGRLVLHASAVATPEGAVCFLGMAGVGKSTLAASFCWQGHPLLTDDCLLIDESGEKVLATPSYAGLRLWSDAIPNLFGDEPPSLPVAHYTTKKRLVADSDQLRFCSHPVPVARLYVLASPEGNGNGGEIHIASFPRRDAFMELVKAAFRLDITDKQRLCKQFERLSCVITSFPVRRLSFPHDFAILPAVRKAILEDLKEI